MITVTDALLARLNASIQDRKSTRLNSSHTVIYTLSLHDALPISDRHPRLVLLVALLVAEVRHDHRDGCAARPLERVDPRSEEHTSELQSHSDLHSFPTRRSSDLGSTPAARPSCRPSGS